MHPIQCKCGAVRGHLEGTGTSSRLVCYCTDCGAFARFRGQEAEVLDGQGGTEIDRGSTSISEQRPSLTH